MTITNLKNDVTDFNTNSLFNDRSQNANTPATNFREAAVNYIRLKENASLFTGIVTASKLIVPFEGPHNPTIGYGFNLSAYTSAQISLLLTHAIGTPDTNDAQAIAWLAEWRESGTITVTWTVPEVGEQTEAVSVTSAELIAMSNPGYVESNPPIHRPPLEQLTGALRQFELSEPEAEKLLEADLFGITGYTGRNTRLSNELGVEDIGDSVERVALLSMFFNSESLIGPGIKAAMARTDSDDARAEAWFQIMYNHTNTGVNLQDRRAEEASLFGLIGKYETEEELIVAHKRALNMLFDGKTASNGLDIYTTIEARDTRAGSFFPDVVQDEIDYLKGKHEVPFMASYDLDFDIHMVQADFEGRDSVIDGKTADGMTAETTNKMIFGEDGDDTINGVGGNNMLYGGDGDDTITGGDQTDLIWGDDSIDLDLSGDDTIDAGAGNDFIFGGKGFDEIRGGDGDDVVVGQDGDDTLYGDSGNDQLIAGAGEDHLWGGAGYDIIVGGAGTNYLHGDDDNEGDILEGRSGVDHFYAGEGDEIIGLDNNDKIYINGVLFQGSFSGFHFKYGNKDINLWPEGSPDLTIAFGSGQDIVIRNFRNGNGGIWVDVNYRPFYEDEIDQLTFEDEIYSGAGDTEVAGGSGNDSISGGQGHNSLYGGAGSDTIHGNGGDDILKGEKGVDTLDGGDGNDTADYSDETVSITANLATQSVNTTDGLETVLNIENIIGGSGNDSLTGDGNDNVIEGNLGDDVINGGDGIDVAVFNGNMADYSFTVSSTQAFDVIGTDGTDTVSNIEILRFDDQDVIVDASNTAPVTGGAIDLGSVAEDTTLIISEATLLAGSSDADNDTLSVSNLKFSGEALGTITNNHDGTWTYQPGESYNGAVQFEFDISDGSISTASSASLIVSAQNDAPDVGAAIDLGSIVDSQTIVIAEETLLNNSGDVDGDTLSISSLSLTTPADGTLTDNGDGTWTFDPAANFNGTVGFDFDVSDGTTTTASTASLAVTADNDAPVIDGGDVSGTADEDNAASGTLTFTDVDGDSVTWSVSTDGVNGTVSIDASGNWTYTPNADWNGSDSFTVTADDGNGGTDTQVVNVTIDPVNDAPDVGAATDLGSIAEDGTINITAATLLANSSDVDGDTLSISSLSLTTPADGTLTDNGDGTWTFDPAANINGTVGFDFDVSDGTTTTASTASLSVTAENDVPVINGGDVSGTADEDNAASGTLTFTDADGDSVTWSVSTDGVNGTASIDGAGNWTYTPDADWNGSDSFTVTADDGNGGTDTQVVNVTIDPVNDAPDVGAAIDLGSIAEDGTINITAATLLANSSDVDGDTLSISSLSLTTPADGTLTDNGDGTWTFDPAADFNGTVGFDFNVSDGTTTSASTASLSVTAENDLPVVTLSGYNGNDTLNGTSGIDVIEGLDGWDTLNGYDGDDIFIYDGNPTGYDVIDGGDGVDTLLGGSGDDHITINSLANIEHIDGGAGYNKIIKSWVTSLDLRGISISNIDLISGSVAGDTLYGNDDDNVIDGNGGSDTLNGEGGNDTFLYNGVVSGFDTLDGGAGQDTILGGDGNDEFGLNSVTNIEVIDGGLGTNIIHQNWQTTLDLRGVSVSNIDLISGSDGTATIWGSDDDNVIEGNAGQDTLYGEGGNDIFLFNGTDNWNDRIHGGDGIDTILGGDGDDTIILQHLTGVEVIDGGLGYNILEQFHYDDLDLRGINVSNIDVITSSGVGKNIWGSDDDNIFQSSGKGDKFFGEGGNDTFLYNGSDTGKDVIDGGDGIDSILGGAGDDEINLNSLQNVEVIDGGAGTNTIIQHWNTTLDLRGVDVTNINMIVGDEVAATTYGSDNDNVIDGNGGGDTIYGEGGNDTIIGGLGIDALYGGDGDDVFIYEGLDNGRNDHVYGGDGFDTILGGDGDDVISLYTLSGVELIDGGAGNNILEFYWNAQVDLRGVDVNNIDIIVGGDWGTAMHGNDDANVIDGGLGHDTIYGEDGDDTLIGSEGNDTLNGGDGMDVAVFSGNMADYTFTASTSNPFTVSGIDGTDTVSHVETLRFDDQDYVVSGSQTPVVLDLDGDGVELVSSHTSTVLFDQDGDGDLDRTGWVGADDGLLVLDRNEDGVINDGSEISFVNDLVGATTDMEGLVAYDTNGDGIFDISDEEFASFQVWQDQNQNGISEEGELASLSQHGISAIDLTLTPTGEIFDPAGDNAIVNTASFIMNNGERGEIADTIFRFKEETTKTIQTNVTKLGTGDSAVDIGNDHVSASYNEAIGRLLREHISTKSKIVEGLSKRHSMSMMTFERSTQAAGLLRQSISSFEPITSGELVIKSRLGEKQSPFWTVASSISNVI